MRPRTRATGLKAEVERLLNVGDLRGAAETSALLAELLEQEGHPADAAHWHKNVGHMRLDLGDPAAAARAFRRTRDLRQPGSHDWARATGELGRALVAAARYAEGAELLSDALEQRQRDAWTMDRLADLGMALIRTGDFAAAEARLLDAHDLAQELDPDGRTATLVEEHLATIDQEQGRLESALSRREHALERHLGRDPGGRDVALAFGKLGLVHKRLGDFDTAAELYAREIELHREHRPRSRDLAVALQLLGGLEATRHRFEAAKPLLDESVALFAAVAPKAQDRINALRSWADAQDRLGAPEDAARARAEAVELARELAPGTLFLGMALHDLGRSLEQQGDLDGALDASWEAIDVFESQRTRLSRARSRDAAFEGIYAVYMRLIDRLMARGDDGDTAAAFAVAEMSRGRVLAEMLAGHDDELPGTGNTEVLAAEAEAARARNRLADVTSAADDLERRRLATEAFARERHLERVRARIQLARGTSDRVPPGPLNAEAAWKELDPQTVVLEYAVGPERTTTFAMTADSLVAYHVDAGDHDLRRWVGDAVGPFHTSGLPGPEYETACESLAEALLMPLAEVLRGNVARLLIVPDGPLHHLPFEMLPDAQGRLLLDGPPIAYAPAFSTWSALRAREHSTSKEPAFVGIGAPLEWSERWPYLDGSAAELSSLASIFPPQAARVLTGPDATQARVFDAVDGQRYVHFATHGFVRDDDPLYSGLVLTASGESDDPEADGLLQAFELLRLRLDESMVVCSACDTGQGREYRGEGLAGLSRALFAAGAETVVLSSWAVPDVIATTLMERFYGKILAGGHPAAALRAAKAELRDEYPDPFLWAAFCLHGLGWSAE